MLNPTLLIPSLGIKNKIAIIFVITAQFFSKHSRLAIPYFIDPRARIISCFTYTSGQNSKIFYS